jgi:hypothetical protein
MSQIHVNGRDYELVTVDQLTLDEAIVVYEYTRMSLDQISDADGFHPGLIAALIHISVARGEPGETTASLRKAVGAIPVADLETVFADAELPPPQPEPTSADGLSDDSGAVSSTTSEQGPADIPEPGTGSRGSDTSAASGRLTSVG